MVVEDPVDAAVRVVETRGGTDRAAARTAALSALERAAGYAGAVFAFEARQSVAAFRARHCDCVGRARGDGGEEEVMEANM